MTLKTVYCFKNFSRNQKAIFPAVTFSRHLHVIGRSNNVEIVCNHGVLPVQCYPIGSCEE